MQENEEKQAVQSKLESTVVSPPLADYLKQILRRLQSKNRLGLDRISQDEESRSNESQLDARAVDLFENGKAPFAFGAEDFSNTPHNAFRHGAALPISAEP